MSAATFLADPNLLEGVAVGDTVLLDADIAHHIHVARIRETESIDVVNGRGLRATGTVSGHRFHIQSLQQEAPAPLEIAVAQALIKGDRLERAVEMMTEIGVSRFIPWQAEHSVVVWSAEKAQRNRGKWVNLVHAATEQSRRSFTPEVDPCLSTQQLCTLFPEFDQVLILEESGGLPGASIPRGKILVVVGPEGGISPGERAAFAAGANVTSLTLGSAVLRSATAGVVATTYLWTRSGVWDTSAPSTVEG